MSSHVTPEGQDGTLFPPVTVGSSNRGLLNVAVYAVRCHGFPLYEDDNETILANSVTQAPS